MSETSIPPLIVSGATLALLKLEPLNPTARSLVLKQVGKPIPDDCATWEAIVKWIADNQPVPKVRLSPTELIVNVKASGVEYGHCRYSVRVGIRGNVALTEKEIADIARHSDDYAVFFENIRERVRAKAYEMEMEPQTDYDYDEHEQDSRDNFKCNFDESECDAAKDILRDADPDTFEILFGEENEG